VPARSSGGRRTNLVVIDPGHGGEERGAQLTETLNEKDVTLALAKRIQHELEARGFAVVLLRTTDSTMTFDQRASAANSSRAEIYLGIHAATLGTGLRVYTALLPPAPPANRRTFLPWDSAQAPFLHDSDTVAAGISAECSARKIPLRSMAAALRPLNNIAGAAVAIEIAPEGDSVESINDAKYQQNVAAAVAAGIISVRGKLESQ
jgi:N-acetylmuramoyl-L-alanine amidase